MSGASHVTRYMGASNNKKVLNVAHTQIKGKAHSKSIASAETNESRA